MRRIRKYRAHALALLAAAWLATACVDGLLDRYGTPLCDYSVQLRYHYNEENTTTENRLERYVSTIDEYIFDGQGVLYAINRVAPDPCGEGLRSELDLPPGRYSVISWGNLGRTCRAVDAHVGVTRREELLLTLDNPCPIYTGYQNNSDRLYYGYRTFRVDPGEVSRIRVDMLHAHLHLRYRVSWATTPPGSPAEYQMRLRGNPSEYAFMAEFIARDGKCRGHDPATDDEYLRTCDQTIHYIPSVLTSNVLHHRVNSAIDVDGRVEGEILAFRLRNGTPTILSLHEITATKGYAERQVMKDIDLDTYFAHHEIDLDRALRQEYGIELVIGGDGTVTVFPLEMSDWNEGGPL